VRVRPAPGADPPPSPTRGRRRRVRSYDQLPRHAKPVALFLAVAGGVVWGHRTQSSAAVLPHARVGSTPPTATPEPDRTEPDWLAIVRALEATRSKAFNSGDVSLLRSVYVAGSPALMADVATLRRLSAGHLRAEGFAMTPIRVQVLAASPQRITLRVIDEISAYTLSDRRTLTHVASTAPRTLTMTLSRYLPTNVYEP